MPAERQGRMRNAEKISGKILVKIFLFFLLPVCVLAMSACTDSGGKELIFDYAQDEAGSLNDAQDIEVTGETSQDKAEENTKNGAQEVLQLEEVVSWEMQTTLQPQTIAVYICGEVVVPGVYMFEEGARLYQAVDAAGGFTDAAASGSINLARVLADGEQITVYDEDTAQTMCMSGISDTSGLGSGVLNEAGDDGIAATSSGSSLDKDLEYVNINEAGLEKLMTLPGIGEVKAQAIIDYRDSVGPFASVDDIKKVPGIKEAAFEKIKSLIRV